jgi:hypothetical protein
VSTTEKPRTPAQTVEEFVRTYGLARVVRVHPGEQGQGVFCCLRAITGYFVR